MGTISDQKQYTYYNIYYKEDHQEKEEGEGKERRERERRGKPTKSSSSLSAKFCIDATPSLRLYNPKSLSNNNIYKNILYTLFSRRLGGEGQREEGGKERAVGRDQNGKAQKEVETDHSATQSDTEIH